MKYRISVIIPSHNRAQFLVDSIQSVLKQTYKAFEIIIIDDGSKDDTRKKVKKLQEKHPEIRYFYQARSGVSYSRNKGVFLSKGNWICFLDSDDLFLEDKLLKQVSYLDKNPDILFVHGEEIWMRDSKRVHPLKKHQKKGGFIFKDCLKLCLISPSCVMLKKDLFLKYQGFREDYIVCEDYDLWLRICLENKLGFIKDPILIKRAGFYPQLSKSFSCMDEYRVLSLLNILKKIKDEKLENLVREEISKKIDVLLKGYLKRKKFTHFKKLESLKFYENKYNLDKILD